MMVEPKQRVDINIGIVAIAALFSVNIVCSEPVDGGTGPIDTTALLETVEEATEEATADVADEVIHDIEADFDGGLETVGEDGELDRTDGGIDIAQDFPEDSSPDPSTDVVAAGPSTASHSQSASFTYDSSVTLGNPLEGFLTSYLWDTPGNDLEHSLEFVYFPLNDVMNGPDSFTFETGLEPFLVSSTGRQNHVILRPYLDYPGEESGVPAFLAELISFNEYDDYGGGQSPDYFDPDLQQALLDFIAAFGAQYDGDFRIAFVQVGLLGHWGEWHTFPNTAWFPDEIFQSAVLSAYVEAFPQTAVQVRYPAANSPDLNIGFHDDSFAQSTIGEIDWFFVPRLVAAGVENRWETAPIGGELRPELQSVIFTDDYVVGTYSQEFSDCVQATHISYLVNYEAFSRDSEGYTGEELERARLAALEMGYQFTISSTAVTATGLLEGSVDVAFEVDIRNSGVAPFYYPLSLKVTAEGRGETWTFAEDLSTSLPGDEPIRLSLCLSDEPAALLKETYSFWLDAEVLFDGQPIRFANTDIEPDGSVAMSVAFSCTYQGNELDVGQTTVVGETVCVCDVDGILRDLSWVACE